MVGPKGDVLYKYDKIHLYDVNLPNGDVYRESDTYKSGNKAIIAKIKKNKIKIGLTIYGSYYLTKFSRLLSSSNLYKSSHPPI